MSFIEQYTQDVVYDMFCMSSTELTDAIRKIKRYAPNYAGTKRGEWFDKVIEKLSSLVPTADENCHPYLVSESRHDDRWGSETTLNV